MPSRDLKDLDPKLQPLARQFFEMANSDSIITQAGARVFPTCTYRSNKDQAEAYAKGRDANGKVIDRSKIVTDEPPGRSAHNCTMADGTPAARGFDFAIQLASGQLDWNGDDPLWRRAVDIGVSLGLVSGANWTTPKDRPHLELPNWRLA